MTHPIGPDSRVTLVDGSGYIFRAFHGLPPLTRKSDGAPIGAVSGFCNMIFKLLADERDGDQPTHLAVIFDASGPTFRNDIYPAYKANRPPAPEDLVPQFPMIREATRAFGLPSVELPGYEADDLIATYARQAAEKGAKVRILSSDKDLMQLITDKIFLYDPMKDRPLGPEAVMDKFGVGPAQVIDVQALAGDSTDNVPGAPGIGVKTAAELLATFGTLEELLDRAHEIKQPKRRETLIQFREQIEISKRLVTLMNDVPVLEHLEHFGVREPEPEVLLEFLRRMELRTLTGRVEAGLRRDGYVADKADHGPVGIGAPVTPAPAQPAGPQAQPGQAVIPPAVYAPVKHSAYETITDLARLDDWLARVRTQGHVAFDTETDALNSVSGSLVGLSLAVEPGIACYIPVGHRGAGALGGTGDLFASPEVSLARLPGQLGLGDVLARLKPVLEDDAILKIGQNLKYDLSVMAQHGIAIHPIDDTMLMSFAVDAGRNSHGMDDLSLRLLGHQPIAFKDVCGTGKSQISFDQVPIDRATAYAAEDADITLRLWHILKPRLVQERCTTVYETLERPLVPVIAAMEQAGVKVDVAELSRLSLDFAQRMTGLEAQAHEQAGENFNLGSPKQLGDILFGKMALPGGKKTATGQWATGADALEDLAAQGHDLPRTIVDWRTLAKLKSTYTDNLKDAIDARTGRVHTSFNMVGAATGRLSSTDPNLQNIPIRTEEGRRIRKAFVAEPGNLLISADYSQIELRLLAHVGDIPQLKRAFIDGHDIHAMTASEMFGVPLDGMDPMVRRKAKAINFGIIYGISAFGLARQLSIPQGEARDYIAMYKQRFPGIQAYMDAMKTMAREKTYVETIFGRRCWVPGIHAKSQAEQAFAERQAINAPLQGAAADIIKRAMIRLPAALKEAGLSARMLLQVHDELVFEAPASQAEATCALVAKVMERAALPAVALTVPLVVEARAASTWAEAH
ncbi:DNA polymerase I [Candidatus Phycosocius bacilliformis]|uniref:DNA polymerase I n=1 Tax=Candidatus Phycosocius bacilliformis TaxID=1445552 RepID=A0A2P2EA89_9PROT|nr:DNA polymerase I [Candidatus Phycosocius bacilliformis]GBF57963.1 DNA polymerase I [Candidatus Phycosocius bacilliformis]